MSKDAPNEIKNRDRALAEFEDKYHEAMMLLKKHCMTLLRCTFDGVPTMLGHVVIALSFSLDPPEKPEAVPKSLWLYIEKLRDFIKRTLIKATNPNLPTLPHWYLVDVNDPIHSALISRRNFRLETPREDSSGGYNS